MSEALLAPEAAAALLGVGIDDLSQLRRQEKIPGARGRQGWYFYAPADVELLATHLAQAGESAADCAERVAALEPRVKAAVLSFDVWSQELLVQYLRGNPVCELMDLAAGISRRQGLGRGAREVLTGIVRQFEAAWAAVRS